MALGVNTFSFCAFVWHGFGFAFGMNDSECGGGIGGGTKKVGRVGGAAISMEKELWKRKGKGSEFFLVFSRPSAWNGGTGMCGRPVCARAKPNTLAPSSSSGLRSVVARGVVEGLLPNKFSHPEKKVFIAKPLGQVPPGNAVRRRRQWTPRWNCHPLVGRNTMDSWIRHQRSLRRWTMLWCSLRVKLLGGLSTVAALFLEGVSMCAQSLA